MTRSAALAVGLAGLGLAAPGAAEPMFLSRQYARCTSCHYSPTGGGLLTPYGRSLSREELSTTGASPGGQPSDREHEFLWGALGGEPGSLSLGIQLRPARLHYSFEGASNDRNLLMNADVSAAWRRGQWTLFAELGRQPRTGDTRIASFEHWVRYQAESGLGLRAGRFLPAYGVRFADHTSFNRAPLGFDNDRQLYALELSYQRGRQLFQVSLSPGLADALVRDDGRQAFTAAGRAQLDVAPRLTLVASGLVRGASDREPGSGLAGLAVGFAPAARLSLWGEGDLRFRDGADPAYTLVAEAAFEAYRGVWLKLTPQLRNEHDPGAKGVFRMGAGLDLLPRTHFNVVLSYYRDRDRSTRRTFRTLLAQLHLYL